MLKKITKKYALADFLEDESGELITASDNMDDIKKSARQHNIDTDGECLLIGLQWNDELGGYEPKWNF